MLLLDGASLEYVWPRAAGGRLPNFARLLETGASMGLATVRPTGPDPVWAAVATGMYPATNGVRSPSETTCAATPARSRSSRITVSRTCWSILGFCDANRTRPRRCGVRPLWSILQTQASPPASCAGR